jgi:transcriptional regulator with XRE-family HTH domain
VSLGSRLRQLRVRSGESLQQVADAVDVSKTYVWQLERDEDTNPSVDVIKRIANHFKTTVSALVGETIAHETDEQLLRMFRNLEELSPNDRVIIEEMIRAFNKRRRAEIRNED